MESSVHFNIQNRLAFLSNLLNPLPLREQSPQVPISYYNKHGHLIVGDIRDIEKLGPVALTQNTYTGEIRQRSLEPGKWTSQVASSANNHATQKESPSSFVEAEEKRRNNQSATQEL